MKARLNETVGLWLALTILAVVAVLAYRSTDAAAETLGWVERTNATLRELTDVSAAYARAASARRAFTVGGDSSQLAEAPDLDARVARAVDAVRRSIADDPVELRRLDVLEQLQKERMRGLDAAVEIARREGRVPETVDGLALAARIRAVREEMEGEENRLLAVRDARTRRDIRRTKTALFLGTVASFVLLLVAFARLRREVARRLASEEALRGSERFLESIVENIPDMIFVKEAAELRFERINRAGEELLGLDRKALLGKNDFDFFPRPQAEFFQARDRVSLGGQTIEDIAEEPIATATGERWLHTKKVPVLGEDGKPKYLLGISEDITESRKTAAVLKAAKDSAEAANKELEAFSYSVAHDLRAPLRAIDGFSQALLDDFGPELATEAQGYLGRVRTATRRMGELIDGLLGLSRLSRGELVREKVDLSKIAQETAARLVEAHPDRKVELVIDPGLEAEGDARLLSAALDNLMSNAWKFTGKRERPRVEVGRRIEDGHPVFFVRDNGAGFEQAYANKLFGAFQRLHTTKEFEGTGIGLATVQRIVRRHGGRVWAEGQVGRGATFYFTL